MSAENCRDCEELEEDLHDLQSTSRDLHERYAELDKRLAQAQASLKASKKEHHRQRCQLKRRINQMQAVVDAAVALVAKSEPISARMPPQVIAEHLHAYNVALATLRIATHDYQVVRKAEEEKRHG